MTNLLTPKDVLSALTRLSMHYPESSHNPSTLLKISTDYHNAFSGWSAETFKACCREVIKNCRFWPKIADFYEAYEYVQANGTPVRLALPEPNIDDNISPKQAARNVKCAKIWSQAVAKKITWQEAEALVEETLQECV